MLDFNLREETAEPIAHELRARGTPFIFLSGVSREMLPTSIEMQSFCQNQYIPPH